MANYNHPWNYKLTKKTSKKIAFASEKCSKTKKKLYKEGKLKSWNRGLTKETDKRLKIVSKKTSKTRLKLSKEGKLVNYFKGRHHSKKTRLLRSKQEKEYAEKFGGRVMGLKWTEEQKIRLKQIRQNYFKAHPEIIRKIRISRLKQIADRYNNGEPITPTIGKDETEILDQMEIEMNKAILRQYKVAGFFLDGYCPALNLAIEIDEAYHFENDKINKRDIKRQKEIEQELGCEFLRIDLRGVN